MDIPPEIITLCERQGTHVVRVTVFELASNPNPPLDDLMDLKTTARLVGLSLTAFRDLRRDKGRNFPRGLGSARKPLWSRAEVVGWLVGDREGR